jgi:outer membrane protein insertion porin family/translocation and assembly module TamA
MIVSEIVFTINGETSGPLYEELVSQLPIAPGSRFTTEAYRDCEKVLLRSLADRGHPKAHVDLNARLDKLTNLAAITVKAETGPVCYFGPVTVEGNNRVEDNVILRELAFHTGEQFSASKIQESQRRLLDLRLFTFVDLIVQDSEKEGVETPIHIVVKEARKQTVRFGAGYGAEEEFRGKVQWEIRDFLGDGRRVQVNAKASALGQLVEGNFFQPYFLGTRSSLAMDGGWAHESETSFENRKIYLTPRLKYNWTEKIVPYVGYNLEANRLLSISPEEKDLSPTDQEHEEYFVSAITGGFSWDNVDDLLNSTRGFRLIQALEWASVAFGSEVDYLKLSLEGRGFLPLQEYGVLGLRLKWGGIKELENTQSIPIFKRFFAGGSNSVRGYPYQRLGPLDDDGDPIGGLTLVEGNLDWRFPLPVWKSLEGVLFFDWGNVYEDSYHLLWDELRYTAGAGFRYKTPVGPVRLDVGYQLNPPDQDFFNRFQFHFSIGQAF